MIWCYLDKQTNKKQNKRDFDQSVFLYEIWNEKHRENKAIRNDIYRWKVL